MEKLTYRFATNDKAYLKYGLDEKWRKLPRYEVIDSAIQKLAEYEELEEKRRLFILPCGVGDTVYKLWYKPCHNGEEYPDSYTCCGCEDECDLKRSIFEFIVPNVEWILQHMNVFGDHVWFLTREEAEEELKRVSGE